MSQFPKIHAEKCPYCGNSLQLVEEKYVWDNYYECVHCHRKYSFKNSQPPDIKAVYQTQDYRNYASWKQREEESKKAPAPAISIPVNYSTGAFQPYICKCFRDSSQYGDKTDAHEELAKYLNSHQITRDRIVALNSAAYGGNSVITLVYI